MNTQPPTECRSWQQLAAHAESWRSVHLRELFANDAARSAQFVAEGPGLRYDYSRQRLGAITLRLLSNLAGERGLAEWRQAGRDAVHRRLQDLHHAGDDGERRGGEALGRQEVLRGNVERRGREEIRRRRNPADVGLGRRTLLGVVGGGLRGDVRDRTPVFP